jgi:hypothetical protein
MTLLLADQTQFRFLFGSMERRHFFSSKIVNFKNYFRPLPSNLTTKKVHDKILEIVLCQKKNIWVRYDT